MVREVKFSFDEFDERSNPNLTTGFDQFNDIWDDECEEEQLRDEWEDWVDCDFENGTEANQNSRPDAKNNPDCRSREHVRHLANAD